MGAAVCCGSSPVLEPGNQMLADRLGIDNHTLVDLRERFYDCCEEVGGVMTIGDFFFVMRVEPTQFAHRCFAIINQDGTGRISFKEFVIGLWNVCSFDEFGLLRFAFQMFDSDSSGFIEIDEIEELVKSVQGNNYEKGIMRFVRSILRDCDKNGDGKISMRELVHLNKQLSSLFLPAFAFQLRLREEFYGNGFWLAVARKRQSENRCKNVKQLIQLSCETEAAENSKDSRALAKKRRNQWNGERCPLGTVAFDTYGQAGMVGSPIQANKNAKVVWDGQRFLPANGKEGKAGKRFGRTQMLMKQFKGINKPNEFNSSGSSATMYNTKATQQGSYASTYGSMASTYGSSSYRSTGR